MTPCALKPRAGIEKLTRRRPDRPPKSMQYPDGRKLSEMLKKAKAQLVRRDETPRLARDVSTLHGFFRPLDTFYTFSFHFPCLRPYFHPQFRQVSSFRITNFSKSQGSVIFNSQDCHITISSLQLRYGRSSSGAGGLSRSNVVRSTPYRQLTSSCSFSFPFHNVDPCSEAAKPLLSPHVCLGALLTAPLFAGFYWVIQRLRYV